MFLHILLQRPCIVSILLRRLNTYFAFWRSSQSAASPLPIAVAITFHSQACAFSQALLPLVEEVAQHYSKQSVRFLSVDTAELAYSDMIKMGITITPVIRLHTQVDNQDMLVHSRVL